MKTSDDMFYNVIPKTLVTLPGETRILRGPLERE